MKLLIYLQKTVNITRRDYEHMIKEHALYVNNSLVESFTEEITLGDTLRVDLPNGKVYEETIERLPIIRPKLILFYKPKWYVVSKADKHNKTIYDILPASWKRDFYYIGRLDKNSSGLLLLTNDTNLVDYYENPKYNIHKTYEVMIDRPFKSKDKKRASVWVRVTEDWNIAKDGDHAEFLSAVSTTYKRQHDGFQLVITLNEWKKRHIRRLLKALWYKVLNLKRVKIGKRRLWNMKPGKWRIEKKVK